MIEQRHKIYEGKAKILYATDDPDLVIQYFKDDATAFNAAKRGTIQDKGIYNNKISTIIFEHLQQQGIPTHYVRRLSDREMLVKKATIVPIEVIVRNVAAGSFCRHYGIEEGRVLPRPVVEYCYKNDALNDPIINEDHIVALGLATDEEIKAIRSLALEVNRVLKKFFDTLGIDLIDFKLEMGRTKNGLVVADEISPDTCRLWEKGTQRRLDKDRFRRDMGDVAAAYREVLQRMESGTSKKPQP